MLLDTKAFDFFVNLSNSAIAVHFNTDQIILTLSFIEDRTNMGLDMTDRTIHGDI